MNLSLESVVVEATSPSSSRVRRRRISNSEGPGSTELGVAVMRKLPGVPEDWLKYGFGRLRLPSQETILPVHESSVSLGMSIQRAVNSSECVADCVRADKYFFARSEPEGRG